MLDRTQALIQVPWSHVFSSSRVPILVVLGGAGLLCLNLLTLALFKSAFSSSKFPSGAQGKLPLPTSTCFQRREQPYPQWTFVPPRRGPAHTDRGGCPPSGAWALFSRQVSCFPALSPATFRGSTACGQNPLFVACPEDGTMGSDTSSFQPQRLGASPAGVVSGPRYFLQDSFDSDETTADATQASDSCEVHRLRPRRDSPARGSVALQRAVRREVPGKVSIGATSRSKRLSGAKPSFSSTGEGIVTCALCHEKGPCSPWFVKGAWSRKLRTNPGAPSVADQHHWERLSRAKSWERASSHPICSQCRRWAYDLGHRGQFRAPRQDAQSLLEDSPWESLQAIIEKEPSMQLLPKSAPLLAWIEQHESDFAEGSLAHWLAFRIATCLEEDIEDAHGIHCAAAQLRKLQTPQQKQRFRFISANVTSHRREIQTWITDQRPSAFGLQELHLSLFGGFPTKKHLKPMGSRRSAERAKPIKRKVDMHRHSDMQAACFHSRGMHRSWFGFRIALRRTLVQPQGARMHFSNVSDRKSPT